MHRGSTLLFAACAAGQTLMFCHWCAPDTLRSCAVERDAALAAVAATVEATRHGEYSVLFLMGDAGLGKTSLVAHARAAAGGLALGWAEGVAAETALPFGLLSQALAPLSELDAVPGLGSAEPGPAFTSGAAAPLETFAKRARSCCSSMTSTGLTQTPCRCWASSFAASVAMLSGSSPRFGPGPERPRTGSRTSCGRSRRHPALGPAR